MTTFAERYGDDFNQYMVDRQVDADDNRLGACETCGGAVLEGTDYADCGYGGETVLVCERCVEKEWDRR